MSYTALARKYRPRSFEEMSGQQHVLRALTNALDSGRIHHAFLFTGTRGVGKTTVARLFAKALNCERGISSRPCGQCDACVSIDAGRFVDLIEVDAASRTKVDDTRELLDNVQYLPSRGRFKIYLIDEVHMLTTHSFNALLKTLEEPPEHVKFVFATTEIRKIPVTVLSRCQRFDLRRVEMDVLAKHFAGIAEKEQAQIEDGALKLIARAADGSVRDGLSLLDQAISHGAGLVTEEQVRDMLGLADRARVFDLFETVMSGRIAPALDQMAEQYALGADPAVVMQDLLDLTHWLTRLKITPDMEDVAASETERVKGREMASRLGMAVLTRTWQMLLKGLAETRSAPNPLQAAEMAIVRLAYAADLPTPAEAIEQLRTSPPPPAPRPSGPSGGGAASGGFVMAGAGHQVTGSGPGGTSAALKLAPGAEAAPLALPPMPQSFAEVVALFMEKREGVLATALKRDVRLVRFQPGRVEFRLRDGATHHDLAPKVARLLSEWTGRSWVVAFNAHDPAEPTLAEQEALAETRRREDAASHPLVKAVLDAFPGAAIEAVRDVVGAQEDDEPLVHDEILSGEEEP